MQSGEFSHNIPAFTWIEIEGVTAELDAPRTIIAAQNRESPSVLSRDQILISIMHRWQVDCLPGPGPPKKYDT